MALIVFTPPLAEPVSLPELKQFLRVDAADTSQDSTIADLALAARAWAEAHTNRPFVQQGWSLFLDFFPGYIDLRLTGQKISAPYVSGSNAVLVGIRYALRLPYPPLLSVDLFQYQNANGEVTEMIQGQDYFLDAQSNPARLTPPFGAMWPVARVVVNAIQLNYTCGYARTVQVSSDAGSPPSQNVIQSEDGYVFQASDVGRPIYIPGADASASTLGTIITAITSPPSTQATLRDPVATGVENVTALLVNAPNGNPRHFALIRSAIKNLVAAWFTTRVADETKIPRRVKDILSPVRDYRY
jgi:hypothetical protein